MIGRFFFRRLIPLILPPVLLISAAACSSTDPGPPPDPELATMTASARKAYSRGRFEGAARFYSRALERAREMDAAERIGTAAYNLAVCRYLLKEYDEVEPLLEESKAAYEEGGAVPADLILLEARLALQLGDLDRARSLADVGAALEDETDRIGFLILRGRIALTGGDDSTAREYLQQARDSADDEAPPLLVADLAGLEGGIREAEEDFTGAGRAYDRQAEAFRAAGRYRQMALALGSAGEAYGRAADHRRAADRFFRSARSLFAGGDAVGALKMLEPALDEAGASDDEYLRKRTVELFEEIKEGVEARGEDGNVQ